MHRCVYVRVAKENKRHDKNKKLIFLCVWIDLNEYGGTWHIKQLPLASGNSIENASSMVKFNLWYRFN